VSLPDSIWFLNVVEGFEITNSNLKFRAILKFILIESCRFILPCVTFWYEKLKQLVFQKSG